MTKKNTKKKKKKKKKIRKPEFLYLLTRPQKNRESLNLVQLAATILGAARCIFFDHMMSLLNLFDPRKAELVYMVSKKADIFLLSLF